ncbi:hypothetical protein DID74_00240 [Candidatus Marinamargulisbacteria bacterium SCGC AG-333-B06]|nr:hypothetical protein DID74_00240 [Candidatus Marinamargulisbacteria bacterium SCGC AG-333-B06]
MIVILLFLIVLLITAKQMGLISAPYKVNKWFLMNGSIFLFLGCLHFIEIQYFRSSWFNFFDEQAFFNYMNQFSFSELIVSLIDQYHIFYFFGKLTYISGGEFMLKIVHSIIALFTLLILYKQYHKNKFILMLFPFMFFYFYLLSLMNMRDVLMYCIVFLLFYILNTNSLLKTLLKGGVLLLILFSLRPLYAPILLLLFLWIKRNEVRALGKLTILIGSIGFCFLMKDWFLGRIYNYFIVDILSQDSQRLAALNYGGSITPISYIIGFFKQLFTPFPLSKIKFLLTSNQTILNPLGNLYLIEISRIILMSWVYILTLFSLLKIKSFIRFVYQSTFNTCLFYFSIINTLFYTAYNFGSGSSRTKLFPFFLLFLFFCEYLKERKERQQSTIDKSLISS